MDEQPQNDSQPDSPQPAPDQDESSTAPSEDTGGSSPEVEGEEEAPVIESPEAVSSDPLRPAQGSTNPKTAPVPPAFPLGPVEVKPSRGPVATRPSSRIKEAQRNKKAQRDASIGNS